MFNKILFPIDLTDEASWQRSLPIVTRMALDYGAELHVVSVLPDFGLSMVGGFFKEGFEKEALKQLGDQLREWVGAQIPPAVNVKPHVLHGSIYAEIMRAADRLNVDVIVIGAHRPEFSDYLLGPNAARVVRHAKQSVFVVRDDS
ncbi:MAG: universal stress protein [Gammaproteobacteria bacterium]|nr:universal stress protein [Gammaproteobacteria bacterium]